MPRILRLTSPAAQECADMLGTWRPLVSMAAVSFLIGLLAGCGGDGGSGGGGSGTGGGGTVDYTLGGTVTGLASSESVILQNVGGSTVTASANGAFQFPSALHTGTTYSITVFKQPTGQSCTVADGSGTMAAANFSGVKVSCVANQYDLAVQVSGLPGGASVSLQNKGADTLGVTANGTVNFNGTVASGSSYDVTVLTQPTGAQCTVAQPSGTIAAVNVTVSVACTATPPPPPPATYTVGGSVTGLSGTVVLEDNGGNALNLTSNGSFTFSSPLAVGSPYTVTVSNQPSGQTCTVAQGSGTVTHANITNVGVTCTTAVVSAGDWVWVSGPNTSGSSGNYGTLGTAAATNTPPARWEAARWTDPSGNFWMFGGATGTPTSNSDVNSDLWMYSAATGQWTWQGGANTVNSVGSFGTLGVAAGTNQPPARADAQSWVDANGNFWIFGGVGCTGSACSIAYMNDLWKYSPTTHQWAWMGGSQTAYASGTYGTQGTPSPTNIPGGRFGGTTWTDSAGDLWLFGGQSVDAGSNFGTLNDLWRYSIATGQWTWMGGSSTYNGPIHANFGTKGVAASTNWPAATQEATAWRDSAGNLWLFSGFELQSSSGVGDGTDLWEYSVGSGEWTWISGAGVPNTSGVYGTQGVAATSNQPGSRQWAMSWVDPSGNFWVYGGYGYSTASDSIGTLADLWKFTPSNGEWTWMSGTTAVPAAAVYGTQGAPASANLPGSRSYSCAWADSSGNLWLFGGGTGLNSMFGSPAALNDDMWEYLQ